MHGDGPRQAQGILAELTLYLLAYLLGVLVDDVAGIGPYVGLHLNLLPVVNSTNTDVLTINGAHDTQLAIIVTRALRIVLEEHHLAALLEHELLLGRIGRLGKGTRHLRPE